MKIRLLDRAGYNGLRGVKLPVVVDAVNKPYGYDVSESELRRIGVPEDKMRDEQDPWWPFPFTSTEIAE